MKSYASDSKPTPRRFSFRGLLAVLALCLCGLSPAANAAAPPPLAPGGSQFPMFPGNPPAGATLLASATTPFSSPTLIGTLVSQVFVNDAASPFGPSAITFTYQLSLSTNSPEAATQLSVSRFDSFQLNAGTFSTGPSDLNPAFVSRSNEGGGVGDVIQFHFGAPGPDTALLPGERSTLLIVETSATSFHATTATVIDDAAVPTVSSFAPLAVPEPGVATIGAIGLALFGLVNRLRNRR